MDERTLLVGLSTIQLVAGVAGNALEIRAHRSFDVAFTHWRGEPDRVARDSLLLGTGLSAPVVMLATQAVATTRLAAGPSAGWTRVLAALGATMTGGYLMERDFRQAMTRPATGAAAPVGAVGFVGAVAMAAVALRELRTGAAALTARG